ncbi:MAG: hypothetical protein K2X48_14890 [Chitinophagaceae bacterium]|nr:hypothetical protein [Chitinophagaceae bacterium]
MKKLINTFLFSFILSAALCQNKRSHALYLYGQYNQTLKDITKGNNPWAMGLGLQLFFANARQLKPTVDFTADAYLVGDKVLRTFGDGTPIRTADGLVNLFTGFSYHPARRAYLSFVAGPSFVSGQTLLGIKPSVGVYLSANQKLTAKISYINVFNREPRAKENFSSLSFSLGLKLF